jgi:quercetin dioxygenase-like cupin family protein
MNGDAGSTRRSPRERFMGAEHVFDLRAIAAGLRDEGTPARDGHRQMTIFHKPPLTLIVFDFETGGRLADHRAEADVTILVLTGHLQVSTPTQTHQVPEGSALVLDPGVRHDVYAPEGGQMLLAVARGVDRTSAGS